MVSDTVEREVGIITCQREAERKNPCYLSQRGTGLQKSQAPAEDAATSAQRVGHPAHLNVLPRLHHHPRKTQREKLVSSYALVSSGFLSVSKAVCDSELQALESWGHTWIQRLFYSTHAHDKLCLKAELHIYFAVIF